MKYLRNEINNSPDILKLCGNGHANLTTSSFCKKCGQALRTDPEKDTDFIYKNIREAKITISSIKCQCEDFIVLSESLVLLRLKGNSHARLDLNSFNKKPAHIKIIEDIDYIPCSTTTYFIVKDSNDQYLRYPNNIFSCDHAQTGKSKVEISNLIESKEDISFYQLDQDTTAYFYNKKVFFADFNFRIPVFFKPGWILKKKEHIFIITDSSIICHNIKAGKTDQEINLTKIVSKAILSESYLFLLREKCAGEMQAVRIDTEDFTFQKEIDNYSNIIDMHCFSGSNDILLVKDNELIIIDGIDFREKRKISTDTNRRGLTVTLKDLIINIALNKNNNSLHMDIYDYKSQYLYHLRRIDDFNRLNISEIYDVKMFFSNIFLTAGDINGERLFVKISV